MKRKEFISVLALLPIATAMDRQWLFATDDTAPGTSTSQIQASMWVYLWDLVDEDYDTVLSRLKDHRLTSVSLASAYHAGRFLAPHNPRRKVVFLEDGTVYFRPTPSLYGRLKPMVNSLVEEGHSLAEVKRRADAMQMDTRAWVVCCHNTPLGMRHPDIVCRNAFDDPMYHNLCPSNPDVRDYIRAIVRDVASQGVSTVELEALQFQGYSHGFHHERDGIALSAAARFLLGLCFCSSCCQRANVRKLDLTPIRSFTRRTLEEFFERPQIVTEQYPSIEALPPDLFEPFLDWRASVIVSCAAELEEAAGSTRLRPMASVDPAARRLVSMDPAGVARSTGGMLILGYVRDGAALRVPLADLKRDLEGSEIAVGFQVGLPESGGRAEFLERVTVARSLGIHSFNFYNYGFIPLENLGWIEEAMR